MKMLFTSIAFLCFFGAFAQIDITFQLDMSNEVVSADGVHIAGSLNGWNTSSTPLTDPDNDDIYTVTLSLTQDADFEYKFLNGNAWGTEETPPSACSVGGNNRIFTSSTTNMVLPVTPFSGCPTPNETQEVTFTVNLSNETISPNGVHVAGNFNGWNPSTIEMTDITNGFYQATVTVLSSLTTVQYKYLNGDNWGTEESIPAPCVNGNSNRSFIIDGEGSSIDLPVYEFGTCDVLPLILPVVLNEFRGQVYSKEVQLFWSTSSETNNNGFEVQHSLDGRSWNTLSFVEGAGTTVHVQSYDFIHKRPYEGLNFYRLKQIDSDGQFEYSDVLSVVVTPRIDSISVGPNPVINELFISNATGVLSLYNTSGMEIKSEEIDEAFFTLDMTDLKRGSYILVINREGNSYSKLIIK